MKNTAEQKYTVIDTSPVSDNRGKHDNLMRKAFPDAAFDNVHDAMDEAYRRSFINELIASEVYSPSGEYVGRCLHGNWVAAAV